MPAMSALPSAVVDWLKTLEGLQDIRFVTEFLASNKPVPLRAPTVAVGLRSVQMQDSFAVNDDGVLQRQEYCRTAGLRLRLGIYVPFAAGGSACHEIFSRVMDALTFASDLNLQRSGCKEIVAQRDTDAFLLDAYADVTADFCPAASASLALASFLPKELLCGSHIRNQDLHLSPKQKAWLDEPCGINTYIGTGTSTRNIALGYKPQTLLVVGAGANGPPVALEGSTLLCYSGMAHPGGGSLGLTLTETGFNVRNGLSQNNTTVRLNASGFVYVFVAIK